jgi:hypothetical protein
VLRLTANGLTNTSSAGSIRAAFASLACLFRNVPLLFREAPATPLRILCVVALDTLHVLRHSSPLSRQRRAELSILLDFQACTNAAWDGKPLRSSEYQALRERLSAAGLAAWIHDYEERLRNLETARPAVGNSVHHFDAVCAYREAVVRLSLATAVGIALNARHIDEALAATDADCDVALLFHLAMQCQVIDDVLDYREDLASGLPGFMTAAPLPQALALTARAVRSYGRGRPQGCGTLPLHLALYVLTAFAALSVRVARRIYDEQFWNDSGPIDGQACQNGIGSSR